MKEENYENIVIIKHTTGMKHSSYDILCKERYCYLINSEQGYKVDCRFVKKYQKDNEKMIYLFSEDDGHIIECNWIVDYVNELVSKGATLINMDKEDLYKK